MFVFVKIAAMFVFVIMAAMFLFSAGVGRTGTYISIDYLLQFVRDHDLSHKVDVFAWVVKMRKNRVSMVQVDVSHDTCLFWFCMFVCLLTSRSGRYYSNGDVIVVGEGLQNLNKCSALTALNFVGIFIVPHLL